MADALSKEGLPADDVASAVAAASDEIGDILKDELGDAEHAERIGAELADLSAELGLLAGLAEGEPRKVEFPSLFEMAMRERARASTGGATSGASSSSSSSGGSRRAPARRHPRAARRQLVAACKAQQQSTRAAARARAGAQCRSARSRRSSAASSRRGASDADDDLDDDDDEWTELEDGASSGASSVKECGTAEEIASSYETCNAYSNDTQTGSPSGTAEAPPLGQFLLPLLTDAGEEAATDFVIRHEDILQVLASAEECARNDIAKMVAESTGQEYQPPRAGEPSPSFNESAERLIVERLRALSVGSAAPPVAAPESPEAPQTDDGAACCEDTAYEADVRAVMEFVESLEGKVLEANEVPLTRVEGCFFGLWNTYYEFNTLMVTTFAASTCGLENSEWTYRVRLFCNCCSCAFRNMNLCSLLQYVDGLVYDLAHDESTMRDAVLLSRALGVIGSSSTNEGTGEEGSSESVRREPCLCGRRPEHPARRDVREEALPPLGGVLPLSRRGCVVVGRRLVALAAVEPSLRQLLTQACCCQPVAVHVPPVAPADGCSWAAECLTRLLRSFLAAGDRVAKVEIRCTTDSAEHESRAARANARLDSLTTSAATGAVVRRGEAVRGQQVGFRVRHAPLTPTNSDQAFVPPCLRCWCHCQSSKLLGMEQRKDLYLKCIKIMLGMYMVMNGGGAAGTAGTGSRVPGAPDEVWAARMQVPFQNILQAGTILLGAAAQTSASGNSEETQADEQEAAETIEDSAAPEASGSGKVSTAVGTEDHQVDEAGAGDQMMESEEVVDDTGGENGGGDGGGKSVQRQVEASSSQSTDDDSQAESDSNTSNSESNSSEEGAESSGDDGLTRTIDHLMRSIGSIECLMDRVLEHCEPARTQDPRETQKQVNHGLSEVDRKLMAMYRRLPEIHQKQMEVYRKQKKLSMLVSARMSRGGPLPPPPPPPLPAAAPPQPAAPSMFALSEYHLARFKEVRRKVMHMREQQLYYHRLRLWLEGQLRLEHMQAEECASSTNEVQDEQKADQQQQNSETEECQRTVVDKEEEATTEEAEEDEDDEDEEEEEDEDDEEGEEGEEIEEEEAAMVGEGEVEGEDSSGAEETAGEVGQSDEKCAERLDESRQQLPVQPAQSHNNTNHHQGQIITMDSIYHQQLRPKARPRGAAKRKLRSQPHRTLEALRWKSAPSLRAAPLFRSRALTRELERKKMETDRLREEVEAPKAFLYDERANVTEVKEKADVTFAQVKASLTDDKDCVIGAMGNIMGNKDEVIVNEDSVSDSVMTVEGSDGKNLNLEAEALPYPDSASPPLHDLSPTNLDTTSATTSKTIRHSSMVTVNKLLTTPVTVFDRLKADIRADFVKFGTPYLSKIPDESNTKSEESETKDTAVIDSKENGANIEGKDSKKGYKYVAFGLEIKKAIEECQSIINSCNANTNGDVCDLSRSISVDLADVDDSVKANADITDSVSDSALSLEQIYESILNLDKNSAELLEAYDVQNEPDFDNDALASSDDMKFAEVVESMPQILANMPEIASKLSEFANLSCELPEFASIVSNLPECTNESQLTPETLKQIRELKINKSRDNVKVTKYMFKRKNVRKPRNSTSDNDVLGTLLDYEVKDLPELYKEDIEKEMKVHMTSKSFSKDEYKDLVCFVTAQVVTNKIFECIRQAKDYELAKCLLDSKVPKGSVDAKVGSKTAASSKTEKESANANVKSAQVSSSESKDEWKDRLEACKRSVFTKFKNIPSQWLESEIEKMSEKIPVSFISCIRSLAEKHDKMKNDLQGKDLGKSSVDSTETEKKSEQSEEDVEEVSPPEEVKSEKEDKEDIEKIEVAPTIVEEKAAESSKSDKIVSEPIATKTLIEIVTKVTGDSKEAASLDAKMIQSSKLCKEAVNSMKCTSNMKFKYMDVITRCAESPELAGWIMLDPGIAANVILEMTGMTPKKLGGEDFSTYSNDRKQAYFIERLQEMNRDYIQSLPKNIFSTDEWLVLLYQLEMLEVKLKMALSKVCSPKKKPAQTQTASSMASETREAELVAGKGLSRIINNCNFKSVKRPSPAVLETIAKEAAAKEQAEKAILEQRKIELSKQYPPEPSKTEVAAEVKKEETPTKPEPQPKDKPSEVIIDRVDKILSINSKSSTAKLQPQPNPESENKQNQELDKKTKNNILLAKCEAILKVKGDKELLERFYVIKSCITQGLPVPEGYKKHVISICKGIDAKLLDIEEMIRKNNKSNENDKIDSPQCQKANKEAKSNESGRKCSSESDPTCVHSDENDSDSHCHSPAMCCPCDPKTGQHIAIIGSQNPELLAKYSAQALRNAKQSLNVVAFNSIRNGNGKGDPEHSGDQDKSWNAPKSDCKWTNDCICSGCRGNGGLGANASAISLGDIVKQCYEYDINTPNGGNPTAMVTDPPTKDCTDSAPSATPNEISKESAVAKESAKANVGTPGSGAPLKGQQNAGNGRGGAQGTAGGGGSHQHVCRVGHTQGPVGACTGEGGQNTGFNGDHPCNCCYCTVFGHAPPLTTPVPRNYNETRERLRSILNRKKQRCKAGAASPQDAVPPQQQPQQQQAQQQTQQQAQQQARQSASPQTHAPTQGTTSAPVATSGTARPPPGFAYPPAGPPPPPVDPAALVAAAASHANLAERMARMTLDPASSGSTAATSTVTESERTQARPAATGAEGSEVKTGSVAAKSGESTVKMGEGGKRVSVTGHVQGKRISCVSQQRARTPPGPPPGAPPPADGSAPQRPLTTAQKKQLTNYWRGGSAAPTAPARTGQQQPAAGPQARVASSRDTSAFSTSSGYSGFSGGIEEGEHIEDTRDLDALLQYIEGPAKVLDRSKKRAKKARQKAKKIEQRIQCELAELAALARAHARLTATMRAEHERARRGVEEARAALRAAQRAPAGQGTNSGSGGGRRRGKKSSTTCPTLQAKVQAAAERLGELTNALKVSGEALVKAEQKRSELDARLAACLAALREARRVQGLRCESDADERDPQLEHDEDEEVRDETATGTDGVADASGAPYVVRIRRVALGGEAGVTLSLAAGTRTADTPLYALVGGRAVALRPDVPEDIAAFAAASSSGNVPSTVTQPSKNASGVKEQQGKKQNGNEPEKQLNKKAKEKKNQEQKALSEAQKNVASTGKLGKSNVVASSKENHQQSVKKQESVAKVTQNHVSLKSSNASSSSIDHSRSTSVSDVPLTKKQRKILAKQQAAEKSRQEEEAAKKAKQKEKESKSKEKKKATDDKGKKGKTENVDTNGKGVKKDEGKNKGGNKTVNDKSAGQGKEKECGKAGGGKSTAGSVNTMKKQETAAQSKGQNQANSKSNTASKKSANVKSGQDQQQQNQSKVRQVGPETTIEIAQKKPSGQHSKPTLSSSETNRGSPASCSIMEQLSCGVQVADLKLPPGITLTRVDPSKQVITNSIKSVPLSKATQLPAGPTPPARPSPQIITAYPGVAGPGKQPGVIVMDSHGHHPAHLPEPLKLDLGLATARQPGKSKKAKKKARAAAAAAAASGLHQYQSQPVGASSSSGARMVTLRNPMFHPGLPAVSVATENGHAGMAGGGGSDKQGRTEQQLGGKRLPESNIRIPDPIPMPPAACQATITPTSNGMYTIRNPLMSMVHQQGLLRAPGPPSSAQHINPLLGNQPTQYASQPYLATANLANYAQHTSVNNVSSIVTTVSSTPAVANHNPTQTKTNTIQNYEVIASAATQMSPASKLTDSNALNNGSGNNNNNNTSYDPQHVVSEYNSQQRNDSGIAGFQHSIVNNINNHNINNNNNSQPRSANVGMNLASFAQQNEEGYSLFKTNSAGETNCHQTSSVHFLSSDSAFGNSFTDYSPAKSMLCSPNPIGTSRPQNNGVESSRSCYGLTGDSQNGVPGSTLYSSEGVRATGVIGQSTRPEPIGKPLLKRNDIDSVTSHLSTVGFGGYAGALYTPFGTAEDRDFRSSLFSSSDQENSSVFCLPAEGRRAYEEARAPFGVESGDSLPYFQRLRVGARLNNEVTIHHVTESKFYKTGLEPAIPPSLTHPTPGQQPGGAVEITLLSHGEEAAGATRKGPAWGHAACSAQSSAGSSLSGSSAHSPADAGGYHRMMMESVSEECCLASGVETGSFGPVGAAGPRLANGTAGRQRPLGLHQSQQAAQTGGGFYSENSIFAPDQSITNLADLDSTDRDIETFKRFEFYFEPPRNKPKVQLNVQDLALHQHTSSSGVTGNVAKDSK